MPINITQTVPVQAPVPVFSGHPPAVGPDMNWEIAKQYRGHCIPGLFLIKTANGRYMTHPIDLTSGDYNTSKWDDRSNRNKAIAFPFEDALTQLGACSGSWHCVLESIGGQLEPLPEGKKCLFDRVIPKDLTELLMAAPMNPTVRTMVHKHIKVPLPDEAQDLDSIKNWIETNVEMKTVMLVPVAPAQAPIPPLQRLLGIAIHTSEYERGRCNYRRRLLGSGEFPISADRLIEMSETSEDVDELMERIEAAVAEDRYDHITMDTDEDFYEEHDGHSADETTDATWEYSNGHSRTRERVLEFLIEVAPRQYATLMGEEPEEDSDDE